MIKHIDKLTMALDDGTIIGCYSTIFHPVNNHPPPINRELVVIIDDPDEPDYVREFAQVDSAGRWSFVSGELMPVPDGLRVCWWAYPPEFPSRDTIEALQW